MLNLKPLLILMYISTPPAFSARLVSLPPLMMSTVHGASPSANTYCVSADIHQAGKTDAVTLAYHSYTLSVTNVSSANTDQTVTLILRAGSRIASSNSGGTPVGNGTPGSPGPSKTLATEIARTFSVAKGATLNYRIALSCRNADCLIDVPATAITSIALNNTLVAPGTGQTCIGIDSTVNLAIQVAEDRGAVVAMVTPGLGRVGGIKDKWLFSAETVKVLGGRPF